MKTDSIEYRDGDVTLRSTIENRTSGQEFS